MNPLTLFLRRQYSVFHIRVGGCGGCGDVVDFLLRDPRAGKLNITECSSPRHADLIVVSGFYTEIMAEAAGEVISQSPADCRVLIVGDCQLGMGPFEEKLHSLEVVPQLRIGGCPPSVDSIQEGLRSVAGRA